MRSALNLRVFSAGLAAGFVAGLVMLIARLVAAVPTPPELMIDKVTAIMPPAVFSFLLDLLRFWARPLLVLGLTAIVFVLSGVLAIAFVALMNRIDADDWQARRLPSIELGVGLWLIGNLLVYPWAGVGAFASSSEASPVLVGLFTLVAALSYSLLTGFTTLPLTSASEGAPGGSADGVSRRAFVRVAAGGAAVVVAGAVISRFLGPRSTVAESAGGNQGASASGGVGTPAPGATAATSGDGSAPIPDVTSNADFYEVQKNIISPSVDGSNWQLTVDGMVDHSFTLTMDDLKALPSVEQYTTLECISNEVGGDLIGNALWKGVKLNDLIAKAGPKPGVVKVVMYAADGYQDSITLDRAMSDANVVAYEMNGETLPTGHGYPARVLVPGIFGMKNVKWLTRIQLVDFDFKGYWQVRGWSDEAIVKTMSEVVVPQFTVKQSPTTIAGVAFAGDRGISKVEVSTDGGTTWSPAFVKPALSPYTWVVWSQEWSPAPGNYQVQVRAVDGTGTPQETKDQLSLPDGATGIHSAGISVG